jgi:SSS family solute:Na+ symporter
VALAHYELHAWCLLVLAWVFVPFYSRTLVFTMPEFLERRFSVASRYVLSIVSLITFIVSKIASASSRGGVVFGTLLPDVHLSLGSVTLDSFWIGSILVIVLTACTRRWAACGRCLQRHRTGVRAHYRVVPSDRLRPAPTGRLGRTAAHRRLGHVQSLEAADSGGRGGHVGAGEGTGADGLVLQRPLPLAGYGDLRAIIGLWYWCTDQYIVQRALAAPNETEARRGSIFAAFLKLFPPYLFIIPA